MIVLLGRSEFRKQIETADEWAEAKAPHLYRREGVGSQVLGSLPLKRVQPFDR